jgi:transposase
MTKTQAVRAFDVSLSSVKRYVKKADYYGESLAPQKSPGSPPKLHEKASGLLAADLVERPYTVTLQERCNYIETVTRLSVSRSTMCRAIARIGSTRKRGGRSASERDEFERAAWRVMVAAAVEGGEAAPR